MITGNVSYLRHAMCNAKLVPADSLQVSPLSSGFMYGEGLFETIRVFGSRPVFFESHYARLASSLENLGEHITAAQVELHARCVQVIAANALVDGSLKVILFKDVTGWTELILARSASYAPAHYERGFKLQTVPCGLRVDLADTLKSLNYLRNILAKRTAVAAGFDEAVFIDSAGRVLEGATTNIFIVKDRVISTPALGSGILRGVLRAAVVRDFKSQLVRECAISPAELQNADEVFVTNALLGIMPVARVDWTNYDVVKNPITRSVMAILKPPLA